METFEGIGVQYNALGPIKRRIRYHPKTEINEVSARFLDDTQMRGSWNSDGWGQGWNSG